jgi:hypothetical protein
MTNGPVAKDCHPDSVQTTTTTKEEEKEVVAAVVS